MRFKKILAGVLASVMTMTAGILPNITPAMQRSMTASAEEALKYGDYLSYKKVDEDDDGIYDYIKISGCDNSAETVDIPNEIDGLPVTTIGGFSWCVSLENVTIPDSVTEIGNGAFSYCVSLASVTIPDSVTTIGNGAFFYCESLASITIPDSVTTIGERAFSYCESLASIDVTENNQYYSSIDGILFDKNKTEIIQYPAGNKNTTYTIPDSVTTIGYGAFFDCESLESVTIPDSVTTIGDSAFYSCKSLKSVTIPDSVTSIGIGAFSNTALLDNQTGVKYADTWIIDCDEDITSAVEIKKGTKGIGSYAFSGCTSLSSITIPDSVTSIGIGAFSYCTSLESITIPDSVTIIGKWAFSDTALLDNQTGVKYADTWIVDYDEDITSAVEIKEGTKGIGNGAFFYCTSLVSVTIPDSVTTIGESAFSSCINLSSITIPDSVTSIGNSAFDSCESLESITIPDSVTKIGWLAFYYCESLESIRILNPDCEIYDSESTITNFDDYFGGTIYGYENSTAQTYAEKYDKNFTLIGDINHDGKISVADIVLFQNALVKKDELTPEMELNFDDKINVFDLIILKRKVIYG